MLLTDLIDSTTKVITEGIDGTDPAMFLVGTFALAGTKNRNGRTYPKKLMQDQVNQYKKTHVSRRRALGEYGHPDNPAVNLERVSHLIETMDYEPSGTVHGKVKLIQTPFGEMARRLISEGIELGFSTRGTGQVAPGGIVTQWTMTAVDLVADPSAPQAIAQAVSEGKDYITAAIGEQKADAIKYRLKHGGTSIEQQVWDSVMGASK